MLRTLLACLIALAAIHPKQDDPPSLSALLREGDVIVVGEVVGERDIPRQSASSHERKIHAREIRVQSSLFGAPDVQAVFVESFTMDAFRSWKPAGRAIFILDEQAWYLSERNAALGASPEHLYGLRGCVPLRTTPHGEAPDLGGLSVPKELTAAPEEKRLATLLAWIQGVIDASVPRLRIVEVGNKISARRFTLEPSGQWSLEGGLVREGQHEPIRSGQLDEATRKAVLDLVDSERFLALPARVGRDRAPCLDWVSFELRTRSGVHEVMLFDGIDTEEEREADSFCRRIFDALPIDSSFWQLP